MIFIMVGRLHTHTVDFFGFYEKMFEHLASFLGLILFKLSIVFRSSENYNSGTSGVSFW